MNKIGVGHVSITELEKKYVLDALDNERLSPGKYVALFEKEFSSLHDQKYGIMCSSGTAALHVALEVLKETEEWYEETEILVPAITFIATSNACLQANLKPVFVDVDPDTYNIDPKQIEKHITAKTKGIIPVHTFGQPCDMDEIIYLSKKYNLKIIEDCAEAHFAKYKGKPIGSFGDIAAFSTYAAHTITTGIGGIVTTNNAEYMEIARSLIAHGRSCTCEVCTAAGKSNVCSKRLGSEGDKRFTFVRLGYSYRVGELEGAIGLGQLERSKDIINKRRENACFLTNALSSYENIIKLPKPKEYAEHSYMMYPIVIKETAEFSRSEIIYYLEKNNIETRPMLPLLNQPIYLKLFGDLQDAYPVAKWINEKGFYIGIHHGLGHTELEYIIERITGFLNKV